MFIEYSRLCTQSEYGVSTITKRSDTETHQHVIAAISYIVALGTVESYSDAHRMAIRRQLMRGHGNEKRADINC